MQLRAIRSDSGTYVPSVRKKPFSPNKNIRLRLDEEVFAYELILRQVIFETDTSVSNSANCSRWFDVFENRISFFFLFLFYFFGSRFVQLMKNFIFSILSEENFRFH